MSTAVTVTGVLLALVVLAGVILLWRVHALGRRVGSFECAMRTGEHWHAGIATYARGHLDWHRLVSLSWRASRRWQRSELMIRERRKRQIEGGASRIVEVRCGYRDQEFHLAAQDRALDGLVSWLESSPPRAHGESV